MGIFDYIILGCIAVSFILAIRNMNKKGGCSGCSGNCSNCNNKEKK
ncbi:FeoB-associated Cys-rich membrane protein [Anaerotignum sp. MB30-C6]|nr:FeoB-associated Cys-rich membrane protein [Anaerotignum sp. MB30-C6]WMI80755.1 FeoB-associated Cys-rich membrane protein [Anaerotignum sp. MB30-C6]